MRRILILGTGTLAEELSDVISEITDCQVAGFVENLDRETCNDRLVGLPVHWVDDTPGLAADHLAVCGIATTRRRIYAEQVEALGMGLATVVHPTSRVSRAAVLAEGVVVSSGAQIAFKTTIGKCAFLNRGVSVGHHTTIGEYVTLQPGANVAGCVRIEHSVYVGMGAIIVDRVTIGEGSVIGAGAVVTKDIPPHCLALGVPARIVKTGIESK
jgi:sugar O-acyltransferase (sialic acid O-acetyltransferase NeuD family)